MTADEKERRENDRFIAQFPGAKLYKLETETLYEEWFIAPRGACAPCANCGCDAQIEIAFQKTECCGKVYDVICKNCRVGYVSSQVSLEDAMRQLNERRR